MKSTLLIMVLTLFSIAVHAQDEPKTVREDNRVIRSMTKQVDKNGWLYFKRNLKLTEKELFTDLKDAFGLSANDKMVLLKDEIDTDEKGRHQRLQQHYQGIPIEDAEYFLHYNAKGEISTASGKIVEGLTLSNKAKLTEQEALEKATKDIGAKMYAWQDTAWENSIKREKLDTSATWKPTGKLVITFDEGQNLKKGRAKLAFKFEILATNPQSSFNIYIDAQNGKTIKKINSVIECSPKMISATTLYNGQQSFAGCSTGWLSRFKTLKREDNNLNIITKKHALDASGNAKSFSNLDEVFRPEDNWGTAEQQFTSAHWALDKSWTYFRDARGRNGWNGSGLKAPLRVDGTNSQLQLSPGNTTFAAYFPNEDEMAVGRDVMALDVLAHEFTHGMNDFTAKLGSTGVFQSRALNESFADIFGEMVERHTTGATNLRVGNQVPATAFGFTFFRDLVNPLLSVPTAQPNTFEGINWTFVDNGIPHQNGGVQNRWFTLLAQGGFQNGVNVTGIGFDKAAQIAWANLTTRLGSASNFMDARNGAVDASRAIFGGCSNELLQNIRAWRAVGLDAPLPDPEINGPSFVCGDDFSYFPFFVDACWLPGATFTWSFPPEINGIVNGSQLQIQSVSGFGNFTVTAVATFEGVTRFQQFNIFVTECGGTQFLKTNSNTTSISKANIYPNPTSNYVNIDLPAADIDKIYTLRIINTLGQVSLNKQITYFDNTIDISHLSDGFYNFIIQDSNGHIKYSSKIQKNKQ